MQRPGAAEGHQGQAGRVDASLDRHGAQGTLHGGVDHCDDAVGVEPGSVAARRSAAAGSRASAAERGVGGDAAGDQVGVGDGGVGASAAVAGRARDRRRRSAARRPVRRRRRCEAIDPPPAPMVWMSSDGKRTGYPPT